MISPCFFKSVVDIESPTYTADDYGGRTITWTTTHESIPACIQPRSGTESVYHKREAARTTHVMYVRHADVSSDLPEENWRVIATTKPSTGSYNIVAVRNIDELGEFLTIDMDQLE